MAGLAASERQDTATRLRINLSRISPPLDWFVARMASSRQSCWKVIAKIFAEARQHVNGTNFNEKDDTAQGAIATWRRITSLSFSYSPVFEPLSQNRRP